MTESKKSLITNNALFTDFYELTMAQGYWKNNMNHAVVFDMFFRRQPFNGGFSVFAGLENLIDAITDFTFGDDDIEYLRSQNIFEEGFLEFLKDFRFNGDMYAFEEGSIIFPQEPIVRIHANLIEAQIVEALILNIINFQSLIATKTARVWLASKKGGIMEFGLRRAQGPDGGMSATRASFIGGAAGTSNTLAGKIYGIPVMGTMAHSWIMAFPSELEAFRTYAKLYPDNCLLLVDTYDVLSSGVPNAIRVFSEMRESGITLTKYGIRIDSGDLAYLSKKAYVMLKEAGFEDAIICASSDLDEYLVNTLKEQGAMINQWGVGTNLITSKDWPAFGGVYKLAGIKNKGDKEFTPKIKLSENTEKITNPGDKKIYRIYDKETGKVRADLICLAEETFSEDQDLRIFDPIETWKKTRIKAGTFTLRELLIPVFENGTCVYEDKADVMELRERTKREIDSLWEETKRFVNPHQVYVDLSDRLFEMRVKLLDQMSAE